MKYEKEQNENDQRTLIDQPWRGDTGMQSMGDAKDDPDFPNFMPMTESEPRPLTREDVLEVFNMALPNLVGRGKQEGTTIEIKKAIEEVMSDFQNQARAKENNYALAYENRKIFFCGKEIEVPEDTNYEYLCNVLFRDYESKNKIWSNDEMLEAWGEEPNRKKLGKVYTAARDLNNKVATKTMIDNLLIVTTKTVQINPNYLK